MCVCACGINVLEWQLSKWYTPPSTQETYSIKQKQFCPGTRFQRRGSTGNNWLQFHEQTHCWLSWTSVQSTTLFVFTSLAEVNYKKLVKAASRSAREDKVDKRYRAEWTGPVKGCGENLIYALIKLIQYIILWDSVRNQTDSCNTLVPKYQESLMGWSLVPLGGLGLQHRNKPCCNGM